MFKMKTSKLFAIVTISAVFCMLQNSASAQADLKPGNVLVGVGLGFGHTYAGIAGIGVGANMEYSIMEEIGVGGYIGFSRVRYGYGYAASSYDYDYNFFDIGVRGSFHFRNLLRLRNKQFDPYAGVYAGYLASSYSGTSPYYADPYRSRVRPGAFVGARYYFKDRLAVYGEFGYNVWLLNVGLTFKL
jgi:hypothetical protein